MKYKISDRIASLKPSAIREILKATSVPGVIPLAAGNPAPDAFPVEAVQKIAADIFANRPIEALQYGISEGYQPLREAVMAWMDSKGNLCPQNKDDSIIITSGAQQVMDLSAKCICNENDIVISETPSFIGSLNTFRSYNVKLAGVPVENDGICIEKLENVLKSNNNIGFIYTIPNFQNPSGITMSLAKRKRVYELAQKYDVLILEDNPYGDTRIAGENIPTIKSMDVDGRVIYAGSFSKVLAPGIRIGYVIANKQLIAKFTVGKQASDVHSSMFSQMLVEQWMREYDIEKHIDGIKACYRDRLNFLCNMIDKELPSVQYVRPEGGLFVWCDLPENVDMLDFCQRAVEKKVAVVPGAAFKVNDNDKTNSFRVNFTTPTVEDMEKGIKILGGIFTEMNK